MAKECLGIGSQEPKPSQHARDYVNTPNLVVFFKRKTECASKNQKAHCFILALRAFRNFPESGVFHKLCGTGQILKPLASLF